MSQPTACAVMITHNRPERVRKAVECFKAQTYPHARLCILNTGAGCDEGDWKIKSFHVPSLDGKTIGELRNVIPSGCGKSPTPPDIYIHWDDDDYSHPNRIAEQVFFLKHSGADCVGYREMLFWREQERESWLYSSIEPNYALGTSLCYWRRTWERRNFEPVSQGEDERFVRGLNVVGATSVLAEPRMIARIHSSNTSTAYARHAMEMESKRPHHPAWTRTPQFDECCAAI